MLETAVHTSGTLSQCTFVSKPRSLLGSVRDNGEASSATTMASLVGRSIDSVVEQVDVDRIIQRIDVNKIISRINWNDVLDTVDLDRQLARVDMNAVLDRIDVERLAEKSNIEGIIARSSSGLFLKVVDLIRIRVVQLDLFAHRVTRCRCCKKELGLPPHPQPKDSTPNGRALNFTRGSSSRRAADIVQVQGCYSGVVSRTAAWGIDELIVLGSFTLVALGVGTLTSLVKGDNVQVDEILIAMVYIFWGVQYRIICLLLTRRTPGMATVGLLLVNSEGMHPNFFQIFLRQLVLPPLSLTPVVGLPVVFLAWIRSDGRFLHDLLSHTGCVYSWDVRMARLRLSRKMDPDVEGGDSLDMWLSGRPNAA
jgi:uncharacterized RDD family membrane protein YckC